MERVFTGIMATAAPLLLLGLVTASRWRLIGAGLVVVGAVGTAMGMGILAPTDLWVVPMGVGMEWELGLLVLWAVFGAVARTAGPLAVPGPPTLVAMVMGAVLGEVPAAAILGAGARHPQGAARLALAAAGGGMLGRVGDPALLMLGSRDPGLVAWMIPLGLLCGFLARPQVEDLVRPEGDQNRTRTLVVVAVAAIACIPGFTMGALLVGIAVLGVMAQDRRGPVDLARPAWVFAAVVVGLIAIVGGGPEQAAHGMEWIAERASWMGPPALAAAAALLTALSDGVAMSVVGLGILDRALSLDGIWAARAITAGVAVGGLAPLVAAGAVRAGWRLWLLQVFVAVIYVGLFA